MVQSIELTVLSGEKYNETALDLPAYSCCQRLMTFATLKAAPYSAVSHCLYDKSTRFYKQRRFYWKVALSLILLVFAIFTDSSLISSVQQIDVSSKFCAVDSITKANANIDEYLNITIAREIVSQNEQHILQSFQKANASYHTWPNTHNMSPEDQARLMEESQAKKCSKRIGCFWFFGKYRFNCWFVPIQCPDALAAELALDRYTENTLVFNTYTNASATLGINATYDTESVAQQVETLLTRFDIASSFYIIYIVVSLWISSPFVLSRANFWTRIRLSFGGISKLNWIVLVLLLWYGYELINLAIIDPRFVFYWKALKVNPCFLEDSYTTEIIKQATDKCTEISLLSNRFQRTLTNFDYYARVEQTYDGSYFNTTSGDLFFGGFYTNSRHNMTTDFPSECIYNDVLRLVTPMDTHVDVNVFLLIGSLAISLFFKPIVANLCVSIVSMFQPLMAHCGVVLIPTHRMRDMLLDDSDVHGQLVKDVNQFKRTSIIMPLVINASLLLGMFIVNYLD